MTSSAGKIRTYAIEDIRRDVRKLMNSARADQTMDTYFTEFEIAQRLECRGENGYHFY